MSGFAERYNSAREWEDSLLLILRKKGWLAEPFGQAQISEEMRPYLREFHDSYHHASRMRWLPDIMAADPETGFIYLVDAKCETPKYRNGENYTVEVDAVETGLIIVDQMHTPLIYVWPDLDYSVLTPHDVVHYGEKRDGLGTGGSGTAFYLIKKVHAMKELAFFPDRS